MPGNRSGHGPLFACAVRSGLDHDPVFCNRQRKTRQQRVAAGWSCRGGARLCQSASPFRLWGGREDSHRGASLKGVRLAGRDGMKEPAAAHLPSVRSGREDRLTLWRLGPEEHSGNDSGHSRRGPNRRRSRSAYGSRAVRRPSYGFVPSCRGLGFRTGCLPRPGS